MAWRWGKLGRWAVRAAILLVVAGLLLYLWFMPGYVAGKLRAALADAGFTDAALDLRHASLSGLSLTQLRLDDSDRFSVASVHVGYRLSSLWAGRVETIELSGARWVIIIDDAGIDLGPITQLDMGGDGGAASSRGWPFDRIDLHASEIVVHHGDERHVIPVAGHIEAADGQTLQVALRTALLDEVLALSGAYERGADGFALAVRSEAPRDEAANGPVALDLKLARGASGWNAALDLARTSPLTLTVAGQPVHASAITAKLQGALHGTTLANLDAQLQLDALTIAGTGVGDVALTAASAEQALRVNVAVEAASGLAGSVALTLPRDLSALTQADQSLPIELSAASVAGLPPLGATGRLRFNVDGPALAALEDLTLDLPESLTFGGRQVNADEGRVLLDASLMRTGDGLALQGQLHAQAQRIAYASETMPVALDDVVLTLPMSWPVTGEQAAAAEQERSGRIAVGAVRVGDVTLPGLRATIVQENRSLTLNGAWPLDEDDPLQVVGSVTLTAAGARAEIALHDDALTIGRNDPLDQLLAARAGTHVTGTIGVEATAAWHPGKLDTHLAIDLLDLALEQQIEDADATWQISGITGEIVFDSLVPLRTRPGQRSVWAGATLGDLEIADGLVRFTIESPRSVLIERLRWRLGERGRLWTSAFRFDPTAPDITSELFVENLNLSDWLSLVTMDYLVGEGVLNGRIEARLRTEPTLRIAPGSGFLHATQPGTVRFSDEDFAEALMQDSADVPVSLDDLDIPAQVQDRLIEALRDFGYSELRFDFEQQEQNTLMRVYTKGKGRTGARQEIGSLTVNVRNADDLLNLALQVKLGLEQAHTRAVEALESNIEKPDRDGGKD